MDEKAIQEKIDREFECHRCGECCRKPGYVYVSQAETEAMAAFLKKDIREFMEESCEVLDRQKIVLKKLGDEACIFLTDTGCTVHPAKPRQCTDFPYKWRTPASFSYCQGLKRLFNS